MNKWLYEILKDNTLLDNQSYQVSDGVMYNRRLSGSISLNKRKGRQHKNHWNDEGAIWHFMNVINNDINLLIKDSREKSIVLFNNEEYEHNTEDNLIDVRGINCDNFNLSTGNLIGYVKKGDYALKISSRFGDSFLKQIIADADGFVEVEDFGGTSRDDGFEWLLVYLWKTKLKKASRLGLPKQYVNKKDWLNKVKGQIDPLAYQISRNGKYLCSYREHSYDNLAVRLISAVFKQKQGDVFLEDIQDVKNAFLSASQGRKDSLVNLLSTAHFTNPFYSDYNDVIDLSKLLLKQQSSDIGGDEDNSAFFFDVSMLFEYFIRKMLLRNGFELATKFEQRLQINTGVEKFKRKLEPDLVIESERGTFVFDVKYKAFDFIYGVKREDLFQLHTYVGQYGNDHEVVGCGFIYPIEESKADKLQSIRDQYIDIMGKNLPFYVLFLVIPASLEGKAYNQLFKENCDAFIGKMQTIIL